MLYKIHKSYRDIVAICDSELIGKVFEEEGFQLFLKEDFFNGEETSKENLLEIIEDMSREDAIFNIVGEESVNTAIESGIINKDSVKTIQGVPFAMVLM